MTPFHRRLTCSSSSSSCDRRSPLTLASVQIPPTRPDRTGPTVTTFPFEENAGFAFRSRTQTISRESNVFLRPQVATYSHVSSPATGPDRPDRPDRTVTNKSRPAFCILSWPLSAFEVFWLNMFCAVWERTNWRKEAQKPRSSKAQKLRSVRLLGVVPCELKNTPGQDRAGDLQRVKLTS